MRPSYKAPKNLSIRKSITHTGLNQELEERQLCMCHWSSPVCVIVPKKKKKENGRKDIVEFLFSLQMQFNSIQGMT